MRSQLDNQILVMEQKLKGHKLAVQVHSQQLMTTTKKTLSSPTALWFGVGAGFLIGKLSDRPQPKASTEKPSKSKRFTKIIRIVAGVQTASSIATHF